MRIATFVLAGALVAAGCSSSDDNAPKHVSASGPTCCLVSDGQHAAYLLNPTVNRSGDLHVTAADGSDALVAMGSAYTGGYVITPDGKSLYFTQLLPGGKDASLSILDLTTPHATPKVLFAGGMKVQPVDPTTTMSANMPMPLSQISFFTPSGKFLILGVLAAMVNNSPDLYVLEADSGNQVLMRPNGAFDYLELGLPDDTLIFQDLVGGLGITGAPPINTLYWVDLNSAGATPTAIDTRTSALQPTFDGKTLVYQTVAKDLLAWSAATRPASGTKLATGVVTFALGHGADGPIAYSGVDHSLHVVGADGSAKLDVSAAAAAVDPLSNLVVSADGADVYYFQNVEVQNGRGTLMHVAVSAGATPTKVADHASLTDVQPVAGGALLFVQNVDDVGQFGDAMRAARDGSGATPLASGVPVGGLAVNGAAAKDVAVPGHWLTAHLSSAMIDKSKMLADAATALTGALGFASDAAPAEVTLDPATRAGQMVFSDDAKALVFVGGVVYDAAARNYVGKLKQVATAMATTAAVKDEKLDGVSEIGAVVKGVGFVDAPKNATPGVYYVKY